MKTRKFKIRIRGEDESPGENFKRQLKRSLKSSSDSEYDLVLTLPDLAWLGKIFSPERMRLIQCVRNRKPESVYSLAKLLARTHSNVFKDVQELAELGVLELKRVKKPGQQRETVQPAYNWDGFDVAV